MKNKQKVLVTGAAGYIGSILVPALLAKGYFVFALDNFTYRVPSLSGSISHPNLELIYEDVRDLSLIKSYVDKSDIIIPLAAVVGAPACDKNPINSTSINKIAVLEMFKFISNDQQIIMPTTNSAYGTGDKNNMCDESSRLNPLSLYAKDKVDVENSLMELGRATSLRLATVFGLSYRMRLDLLVNNFVFRALNDKYIVLFEGHFKRNYIHIHDVARAFIFAIENENKVKNEIFNVGLSEANLSKLELCKKIKEFVTDFTYTSAEIGKDPDQRNYIVSNAKIEKIGFNTTVTLDNGIAELVKGLRMYSQEKYTNL
jgi:nucleoside-diphosphate-sugar epimerase